MIVRLIHVTLRRAGTKSRREENVDTDRLTVGRGTDNDVHVPGLAVPLHHCEFVRKPDGIYVESVDATDLRVNGEATQGGRLREGDVVRVGQRELRVVPPEGSEDLALEIEQVETPATEVEQLRERTRIGVEHGLFSRRPLSWALGLIILLVFLVVPVLMHAGRGQVPGGENPETARAEGKKTRPGWIGLVETTWISGPLATSHENLADDCQACHAVPFQPTRNDQCVACHEDIGRHTADTLRLAELEDVRCASCHLEHNGDRGLLATGAGRCVDCHSRIDEVAAETSLLPVSGFSRGHPQFRPSVIVDPWTGERQRVALDDLLRAGMAPNGAQPEQSGLRFTHKKHLREDLRGPGEKPVTLDCADCHEPDRSGELMKPVRFDEHCQDCHGLRFDDRHPDRQAPHDEPEIVRESTFEFYAALALRGKVQEPSAPKVLRRRPGERMTPRQRQTAIQWASRQAEEANEFLLRPDGACSVCHGMERSEGELRVTPVRVIPTEEASEWMPLARFDHAPHRMVDCVSCHEATDTETAEPVLMPGIETCQSCHGDTGGVGVVRSDCILCHEFHDPERGRMHPVQAAAS